MGLKGAMKKIISLVAGVIVIIPIFLSAADTGPASEPHYSTGAKLITPEEYLKSEKVKMVRSFTTLGGKPLDNLPPSVDLSSQMPKPGDQGNSQSCYAWATTYAIRSFQKKRELGWEYGPNHIFSPAFMHNQYTPRHGNEEFLTFLNFMITEGAVPWSIFPFVDTDEKTQPSPDIRRLGMYFRELGVRVLDTKDIYSIKAMLASGEPVGVDAQFGKSFFALNKKNPVLKKVEEIAAGHHMVAVGYDDKKHALKVMNSWGTKWGDNGFGWIDYDIVPKIISNAWVLYDRPTPPEIAEYLKDPNIAPTGPIPSVVQDEKTAQPLYSAPLFGPGVFAEIVKTISRPNTDSTPPPGDWQKAPAGDPILIVPEEAGITFGNTWLRMGEPLDKIQKFFSAETSPRLAGFSNGSDDVFLGKGFLGGDQIGRIDFIGNKRLPIMTNLGVGFGTPRSKVQRLYKKADSSTDSTDTYFYQSATKDWGGIPLTTNAAFQLVYDAKGNVARMSLATAYKAGYSGQAIKPISESEYKPQGLANVVDSPEGKIKFTVPPGFTKVDKSVWPNIGVGYFIRGNVVNEMIALTVKVFDMPGATPETLMTQRIPADLESQHATDHKPFRTVSNNGTDWILAEDPTGAFLRFYTLKNGRIFQVYAFSNMPLTTEQWVTDFLSSIVFK